MPQEFRVLIAEDDPAVRDLTAQLLREDGFDVVAVANGEQAMTELGGAAPIHALVTDQWMGGMTGAELVVRASQLHPFLPCLLMTGLGTLAVPGARLRVLRKPFRAAELRATVRAMLGVQAESSSRA